MSLSTEPIFSALQTKFVCGWRDISSEPYCGRSGQHDVDNPAVYTTNGAGPTNTQLFILSPDGIVLHCLPGYWDAQDLACEISLAEELHKIWKDAALTREEKNAKFREMHLAHIKSHSPAMVKRSSMQGFDKKFEEKKGNSDCIFEETVTRKGETVTRTAFKTTDRIMHERIVDQPFAAMSEFDVARCVKYGRPKYDKAGDDKPKDASTDSKTKRSKP